MYLFSLGGKSIGEILSYKNYWLSVGVANGLILIGYLMMYRVDAQNIALDENDLEDTEWLSVKRLKKLKEFQVYDYKSAEQKTDGIVIGAEKKSGSVEVITTSQLHALIVGTTGSGKTTGFVDQNIAVLGKSKGKPSIVISDPKKELYEKHARTLEKEGYKISVLDLREPYSSERWNPMNVLLRRIRLVKDLENNLQQKDGKYYSAGEVFLSYRDARTRMQELKDEIYENAQDLVYMNRYGRCSRRRMNLKRFIFPKVKRQSASAKLCCLKKRITFSTSRATWGKRSKISFPNSSKSRKRKKREPMKTTKQSALRNLQNNGTTWKPSFSAWWTIFACTLTVKTKRRCGKRRMNTKYDYCLQLPNITTGV